MVPLAQQFGSTLVLAPQFFATGWNITQRFWQNIDGTRSRERRKQGNLLSRLKFLTTGGQQNYRPGGLVRIFQTGLPYFLNIRSLFITYRNINCCTKTAKNYSILVLEDGNVFILLYQGLVFLLKNSFLSANLPPFLRVFKASSFYLTSCTRASISVLKAISLSWTVYSPPELAALKQVTTCIQIAWFMVTEIITLGFTHTGYHLS